MRYPSVVVVLALLLGHGVAYPAGPQAPARQRPPLYLYGALGEVDSERQSGTLNGGGSALAAAFGVGQRFQRYFAWMAELLVTSDEFDTSTPLLFAENEADVTTASVFFMFRAGYPFRRFEPFVGAGLGLTRAELEIPTTLIPFAFAAREDDRGLATQLLLGADLRIGKKGRIGLELRDLNVDADFGTLSGGKVDLGGPGLLAVYRHDLRF